MRVNDWNTLWERKEQLTELMDYLNWYNALIDEGVLAEEEATEIFNDLLEECGVCPLCNEKCGGH